MRSLKRNKRPFYYYLYKGNEPVIDENGHRSGERVITYKPAQICYGSISAGVGDAQVDLFGTNITFSRVICIDSPSCPIDVHSVLCVDIPPENCSPHSTPIHDYVVTAVARSLNSVSIAIKAVNGNEGSN